jgi:hypothetical protein
MFNHLVVDIFFNLQMETMRRVIAAWKRRLFYSAYSELVHGRVHGKCGRWLDLNGLFSSTSGMPIHRKHPRSKKIEVKHV